MGRYVNPRGMTKEQWLEENGEALDYIPTSYVKGNDGELAVCLVDNGGFTAAAVAVDQRELEAFQHPTDLRPKLWYYVPRDKLAEVS